jgi:hypothetical protein
VALVAVVYMASNSKQPINVSVTPTTNHSGTTPGSVACTTPATGQSLSIVENYQSFSTNPPTTTQVANTYEIYTPAYQNGLVAFSTGQSSASAASAVSVSAAFPCGTQYSVVGGDNANYFENITTVNSQSNGGTSTPVLLQKYSAATPLVANAVQTVGASTANVYGIGTGGLVTSIFESIQAGTDYFGISSNLSPVSATSTGQSGFVLVYTYNGAAITSINVPGAQRFQGTLPPITYASGQTAYAAFVFPSIHFSQYATPTGASSGYTTFSPQIQTSSSFSGSAQESDLGQTLIPLSNYYGIDGQWFTGEAVNLQTGQALFAATSTAGFIKLFHS